MRLIENVELQKLALELFEATGSGHEVARKLGIGSSTAYRVLQAAGASVPSRTDPKPLKRKITDDVSASLVADYESGDFTHEELGKKYGCGGHAIRSAVKRAGRKLKAAGGTVKKPADDEIETMVRLYNGGMSQQAIAVKLSTSQTRVSRILVLAGCKTRDAKASGDKHGMWKGGLVKTQQGYTMELVPTDHPMASMRTNTGYVLQHRLVMANSLGRPLTRGESVHHINGDKTDNRLENLQLRQGNHGKGIVMMCACCGSNNILNVKLS